MICKNSDNYLLLAKKHLKLSRIFGLNVKIWRKCVKSPRVIY